METIYMFLDKDLMVVYVTANSEAEAYQKFREMTQEK